MFKIFTIIIGLFILSSAFSEEIIVGFEDDDIPVLNEELRKVDTNISDNTDDITTNTTNIATNVTNIAANTSDISDLQAVTVITFPGTTVYSANAPTSYTDLDLSGTVGANSALVFLQVKSISAGRLIRFRTNGETKISFPEEIVEATNVKYVQIVTDSSGIIEWYADSASNVDIVLQAYIK